jgi:hypothetical protein
LRAAGGRVFGIPLGTEHLERAAYVAEGAVKVAGDSSARINAARADWNAGRFGMVPGETEFIPLPDQPAPPVDYP